MRIMGSFGSTQDDKFVFVKSAKKVAKCNILWYKQVTQNDILKERTKIMPESLKNITWGSFTPLHIATLILSLVMLLALYFILRKKNEKTKRNVLFVLSLTAPAAVLYNILVWGTQSTILEYLPLHLCSINALLLPVLVWRKSSFLGNLLPIYSLGAVAALVFNTFQADYSIFDHVFLMYYFPHTFEFGIPWLMLALGLVEIKPRYILPCLGATFVMYTGIHFINLAINDYLAARQLLDSAGNLIQVNYMYSLGAMGNPGLGFFWNLIPCEYFYLLGLFPILAVAYGLMNAKAIIHRVKQK